MDAAGTGPIEQREGPTQSSTQNEAHRWHIHSSACINDSNKFVRSKTLGASRQSFVESGPWRSVFDEVFKALGPLFTWRARVRRRKVGCHRSGNTCSRELSITSDTRLLRPSRASHAVSRAVSLLINTAQQNRAQHNTTEHNTDFPPTRRTQQKRREQNSALILLQFCFCCVSVASDTANSCGGSSRTGTRYIIERP